MASVLAAGRLHMNVAVYVHVAPHEGTSPFGRSEAQVKLFVCLNGTESGPDPTLAEVAILEKQEQGLRAIPGPALINARAEFGSAPSTTTEACTSGLRFAFLSEIAL
jgi:hypothetical protein